MSAANRVTPAVHARHDAKRAANAPIITARVSSELRDELRELCDKYGIGLGALILAMLPLAKQNGLERLLALAQFASGPTRAERLAKRRAK